MFSYQRTYRGPVQAVILDWAGTTVDFGSFAPTAVFLRLFESRGISITAEDARSGMGLMKKDHLQTILNRPAVAEAWRAAHGSHASKTDIDDLFNNFVPLQIDVLKEYAEPIPGCLEAIQVLHKNGVKVGSTTGYIRSMMDVLAPAAKAKGYEPDCIVCPDEVPAGRPFPWMIYQNLMQLGVTPMQAVVKVGDTLIDIEEGLNAGAWSVGLSLTGNLLGLSEDEFNSYTEEAQINARQKVEEQLYRAGAHYVIDGIWDLPDVVEEINERLLDGESPA